MGCKTSWLKKSGPSPRPERHGDRVSKGSRIYGVGPGGQLSHVIHTVTVGIGLVGIGALRQLLFIADTVAIDITVQMVFDPVEIGVRPAARILWETVIGVLDTVAVAD